MKKQWKNREEPAAEQNQFSRESDVGVFQRPMQDIQNSNAVDRRSFLKLVGFSAAASTLSGCAKPVERILPYVNQPPEMTPGVANWYATTCHGCPAGCGALAKVMDGRPIKLEGNPDHPLSRGGLCALGQGSIISLYDSFRQKRPTIQQSATSWEAADKEVVGHLAVAREQKGKVVLLTGTITGPATRGVITDFIGTFPLAEHITYDPVSGAAIREAHAQAYGRSILPAYRFDQADVIVSFGTDFLGTWISPVEFTKQYASRRALPLQPPKGASEPNVRQLTSCHHQFEARLSITGSNADYRYQIAPSQQLNCLTALLATVKGGSPTMDVPSSVAAALDQVARDLRAARGRSLVVSDSNNLHVQLAVIALNETLGNLGNTVDVTRFSNQKQGDEREVERLVREMAEGTVSALLIHGCNPIYSLADAKAFGDALKSVPCTISFSMYPDETATVTKYHCTVPHPIEAWGDAEPQAGRYSLFQPTLRALYDTRPFEESLMRWSGKAGSFHDSLQRHWQEKIFPYQSETRDFTVFWEQMLQRGYSEAPVTTQPLSASLPSLTAALSAETKRRTALATPEIEIDLYETVALRDGVAANNPWLQELPDPITKITWDNYASVSPGLADKRGIVEGQWVQIQSGDRTVKLPAHIQPGQHERTVSIAVGYGRDLAGPVGNGVGANVYSLTRGREGGLQQRAQYGSLKRVAGQRYAFALTQTEAEQHGRPIAQEVSLEEFLNGHGAHRAHIPEGKTNLWQDHDYPEYHWGMTVDLTRCTGCSACVVSCDLENNVPVVGRDEVRNQREMHWLRIDRYYSGDAAEPRVIHQPMFCQQCENASCETVCPVLATVHDDQGLNVQVYNRCVGTRYCANNCPYKVRRFNFFNHQRDDLVQNLALNPDVTVRTRGVMEKCSFCIQRIQQARIAARREDRPVRDGDVRTACQQSCPADAIVFGNMADENGQVSREKAASRGYRVLEELNRRPAVTYLSKVANKKGSHA